MGSETRRISGKYNRQHCGLDKDRKMETVDFLRKIYIFNMGKTEISRTVNVLQAITSCQIAGHEDFPRQRH